MLILPGIFARRHIVVLARRSFGKFGMAIYVAAHPAAMPDIIIAIWAEFDDRRDSRRHHTKSHRPSRPGRQSRHHFAAGG